MPAAAAPLRLVDDVERRARIARRHGIAPAERYDDVMAAVRAMTVLHATEPATVHLALHARVEGLTVADVETAMYGERELVKQLAMRRTLFGFPRELLPAAWGSASARVAATERARLAKDVVAGGLAADGDAWVEAAAAAVLAHLAEGAELPAQQLREQVPEIAGRLAYDGPGQAGSIPVGPRVLTLLGARAQLMRGRNGGHWRTSRPQWTRTERWLAEVPEPLAPDEGYAEIVRRWLWTFGPATTADLQWWLGSTKTAATRALADVGAVPVEVEARAPSPADRAPAWLLPDDLEPVAHDTPWAALLPVLDPTVMGWKDRGFLLGEHGPQLFDRNGNAGTTAWWNGEAVGCWVQDEAGTVEPRLLVDVGEEAGAALAVEAARLTAWLDGTRVMTVYPSPLMRAATT